MIDEPCRGGKKAGQETQAGTSVQRHPRQSGKGESTSNLPTLIGQQGTESMLNRGEVWGQQRGTEAALWMAVAVIGYGGYGGYGSYGGYGGYGGCGGCGEWWGVVIAG